MRVYSCSLVVKNKNPTAVWQWGSENFVNESEPDRRAAQPQRVKQQIQIQITVHAGKVTIVSNRVKWFLTRAKIAGEDSLRNSRFKPSNNRSRLCPKAAVNAPHSRRFAKVEASRQSRQRLECGGFSTAFAPTICLRRRGKSVINRRCQHEGVSMP
jgi:hypothetical protein